MGESLSSYTTLRLGGPAEQLLIHTDPSAWLDTVRLADSRKPFTLGGGSSTVASDDLIPGTVIHMATRGITARRVRADPTMVDLVCAAGEPLDNVIDFALNEKLSGLEYLAGIPGTIGAGPVQNTGAYGQEIADSLYQITAYHWPTARMVRLYGDQCAFRYRFSRFKREPLRWSILEVVLRLRASPTAAPLGYQLLADALGATVGTCPPLAEAVAAVREDRLSRGLTLTADGPDARQAGSVFIDPVISHGQSRHTRLIGAPLRPAGFGGRRVSAGWLLERVGHRPQASLGHGVVCSSRRPLTLTATETTTSRGFVAVMDRLRREVDSAFGIRLEDEPVYLGSPKGTEAARTGPYATAVEQRDADSP